MEERTPKSPGVSLSFASCITNGMNTLLLLLLLPILLMLLMLLMLLL